MKRLLFLLFLAVFAWNASAEPRKTELLAHYMQWFDYRIQDGLPVRFHWNWFGKTKQHDVDRFTSDYTRDIYSVQYPRIGTYDSSDPLVIDYHILTAKSAGISGFMVDWYGPGPDAKFEQLLRQSEANGFRAGICYEEKTCFPDWARNRAGIRNREDAIQFAIRDFRYLKTLFASPAYYRKNGKPVVMVFGHVWPRPKGWGEANGEWRFTTAEWRRILAESGCGDVELLLQQFRGHEAGFNAFLWRQPESWVPNGEKLVADKKLGFYVGTIGPGFDNRGTNGWDQGGRLDPHLGLERLDQFLEWADRSTCDTFQIVTWNDFAEGTCVEPTLQYGQLFLERIGQWFGGRTGWAFRPGSTILGYRWLVLAKKFGAAALEPVREALRKGDYVRADALIRAFAAEKKFEIPGAIGRNQEFPIYRCATPRAAASKPDVPKEKFLLVLLAGQSNMAGRGIVTDDDRKPDPGILMLDRDGVWVPAADPVHFDKPVAGVGPARSFARELLKANPGCAVGLIPAAVGNSALRDFAAGAVHLETKVKIYDNMIARARRAMADGTLQVMLWHHGESALGSVKAAVEYPAELQALIRRIREDLDLAQLPVIAGEVRFRAGTEANRILNDGVKRWAAEDVCAAFVPTEKLTFMADQVHFDRAAQLELGRRYYAAYRARMARPVAAEAPNLLAAPVLKPTPEGGLEGYRLEVTLGEKFRSRELAPGVVELTPGAGRSVGVFYSQEQRIKAGTRLRASIRARGKGIVRLYATSSNWSPVAAWENQAFRAGALEHLGTEWRSYTLELVAPGEDRPFRYRFDLDGVGPFEVTRPRLEVVRQTVGSEPQ